MINQEIRAQLLECVRLNDYTAICRKNHMKPEELDTELMKHFVSLGSGGSAYNHDDPRKAFKK